MASVLDLVKHYQHSIEKHQNDEHKVLKCIEKLFHLDVTVQHLQETGVGRTVNALRKEPGEVGQAARALVYKWKSMVAAEESDQEADHDTKTYNGHGKDSDDYTKQPRIKQEQDVKPNDSSVNIKTEDYKQMNGNHSGSKRKHQTNEDVKPSMKRSKYSSSSDNEDYKRKTDIKIKKESSDSESADTDDSQSESDSEESESSREEIKVKQEVKIEPSDKHSSTSSKHSAHSNHVENKRDSSSSKKSHESPDKHSSTHSNSARAKEKCSPEKSSSRDKSHSSHKHKSTKEKDDSNEKKHRPEYKTSDIEKEQKESKSSSKHSSSERHKSSSRKSEISVEKLESNNDKHVSKSEKYKSHSQNLEKEKHKSSSEKETSTHKHKTKDSSISNSSKEKHSSSSKDKSQDRSNSSKEKSSSHSDKKHSSSKDSKSNRSDNKTLSEKGEDRGSEKKSKHKSSSSSSNKSSKSSNKSKEDESKKKAKSNSEDSDDGIDCGSGASFAEALGMMLSPTKPKKKSFLKESFSPNNSFNNDLSPAALLAPSAKLAPLPALEISALPEISPNYKPRPPPKLLAHFIDEDAMAAVISSKNQRTKVYSGNKVLGKIPTLYEMCVQILQEHIDALEYTGGVPYEILKPVVDRATPQQLFLLEHYNPYLMEDTDHLWQKFCEKDFRNKKRQEMESSREMYIRCQEEQEHRLKSLTANIRMTQEAKKAPIKQTKMAYVDTVVKPPRNVARKQAVHGTAHAASASPAARVASLAAAPNVLRGGRPAPVAVPGAFHKPKKAPLMAKALQLMRGRKR